MAAPDEKKIDDIVAMLDAFMSGGGGHMNIRSDEDGNVSADTTIKDRHHHEFLRLCRRQSGLQRAHPVRGYGHR